MARYATPPKVGLVLGAGGILGGAWLTGALHALATETGWDPEAGDKRRFSPDGSGAKRGRRSCAPSRTSPK